ncbi:hapless 2 [Diachasma alloeum]|uniref:hapless 2 n=1 Tax=Diachasma alloeum TaxID=454923 RepID=UPI000738360E|nr:hapless 2 [Diachasma alloeum]
MSLDVQDVLDEIYGDESDAGHRVEQSGSYRGRNKREMSASGFQIRGGQNCMDRRHPPNVNPEKYLESAHCLRFSDLWYSVYKLEKPVVEHGVYIQIFKRKNTGWRDLTRGEMIRLGTFTRHQRDKIPTIVFTYTQEKSEAPELSLNPNTQRLLIPLVENIDKKSGRKTSEGMSEYLIIPSNQITSEGRECDKAGVGFSAFVMQKDRCARKRGSCLRNQPLDYWRHDVNARQSGKPGCYFLSNFAEVPVNPIKYNVTDAGEGREYLGLVQNNHHVSTLEIEVTADDNNVITTGSDARITEVHVVATAEIIKLSIRLTNTGLVSSDYQARIVGCPSGLPNSWAHAITRKYRVPPQHDSLVTLDIPGGVVIDRFKCNVEVINYRGELVAARRIIVHKMNRCFCLWHCICTCYESPRGFSCLPMTPEHYHQAGFRGPVPAINPRTLGLFKMAIDIIIIITIIFTIFLALGIVKWIIGVLSPPVGRWGLNNLVAGLRIEEYYEPELKCRCVVTDDEGIPIHPDTGRRTVRLCSRTVEFVINSLFLFIYPCCVLCDCMGKIVKCRRARPPDDSKDRLIDKEGPRMISVRSYGDTRNSKLEQEDTEYVITELKRSRVSLQDFSNKPKNKF